jgi:hypothetical protein
MHQQRRFNFPRFDTKAANLHLSVRSASKDNTAVWQITTQIASSV